MSKDIEKIEPSKLTVEDVKKYICASASDKEIFMFLQIAKTCNLNPFLKQIYLVKYGNNPAQILTSYNVYLQRAEKSGKYAGLETSTVGDLIKGDLKAVVKVFRKDWTKPLVHEVYYNEYVQMKKGYNGQPDTPNKFWKEKPRTMICKVAISQAFRLAFPLDFEGLPNIKEENIIIDVSQNNENNENKEEKPKFSSPQTQDVEEAEVVDDEPIKPEVEAIEELMTQEELTVLISTAVGNGWSPDAIEGQFSSLGYRIVGKMKKSLKLEEFVDYINRWDYETLLKTVSKAPNNDTKE